MDNGLVSATTEGAPQGGPLSPLLSNVVLDELDRELERRGHCFVRYEDDCNIYVRSERAGRRVMESISKFITRKLKLKVNQSKSKVDRPWRRWKRGKKRFAELRKRGVGKDLSAQTAGSVHGPWRISRSPALSFAFPNAHFNTPEHELLGDPVASAVDGFYDGSGGAELLA